MKSKRSRRSPSDEHEKPLLGWLQRMQLHSIPDQGDILYITASLRRVHSCLNQKQERCPRALLEAVSHSLSIIDTSPPAPWMWEILELLSIACNPCQLKYGDSWYPRIGALVLLIRRDATDEKIEDLVDLLTTVREEMVGDPDDPWRKKRHPAYDVEEELSARDPEVSAILAADVLSNTSSDHASASSSVKTGKSRRSSFRNWWSGSSSSDVPVAARQSSLSVTSAI